MGTGVWGVTERGFLYLMHVVVGRCGWDWREGSLMWGLGHCLELYGLGNPLCGLIVYCKPLSAFWTGWDRNLKIKYISKINGHKSFL